MRVLIACEESQEVCKAFRARGHEAYSNDLIECSGGHPEWHLQMDCFEAIEKHGPWDMIIAFPPCTFLSKASGAFWNRPERQAKQWEALKFVHDLMDLPFEKIAIENPIGAINTRIKKPDQRIEPFHFGHPWKKETCLWLKGLPPLKATDIVKCTGRWISSGNRNSPYRRRFNGEPEGANRDQKKRSKTFPGIARAMAEQWG